MKTNQLPMVAECGDQIVRDNLATETAIAHAKMRIGYSDRFAPVTLYHCTSGYVPAGSAMRLQHECWGYRWSDGRSNHGKRFNSKAEALEAFAKITA